MPAEREWRIAMSKCRAHGSMDTWKKATLLAAVALTGCASGAGDDGTGSALSGGGGSGTGTVSMASAISYAKAAGVACGANLTTAGAIAMAESSLNPSNTSTNGPTSGCPSGSVDRGLWQINSCYHPTVSSTCAFDPACNAKAMASISSNGTNWSPWSTFKNGAYKKYMGQAQTAETSVCGGDAGGGSGGAGGSSGSGGSSADSGGGTDGGTGGGSDAGTSGTGGGSDGGTGGGSESGAGESDGGSMGEGGYAFMERKDPDRHHGLRLAPGASETIRFSWHDASGLAPPADLWVEADGRPVLQVSSVGSHPFARAGLEVVPIDPGTSYRLVVERTDTTVTVSLMDATDQMVLHTEAQVGEPHDGIAPPSADVILPATFWRASIDSEL